MGVLGSPTRASRRCRSTLLVAGFAGAACDFIFARSFCKRGEPRRGRVRNGVVVLHRDCVKCKRTRMSFSSSSLKYCFSVAASFPCTVQRGSRRVKAGASRHSTSDASSTAYPYLQGREAAGGHASRPQCDESGAPNSQRRHFGRRAADSEWSVESAGKCSPHSHAPPFPELDHKCLDIVRSEEMGLLGAGDLASAPSACLLTLARRPACFQKR